MSTTHPDLEHAAVATLAPLDFGTARRAAELALRLGDTAVAWRAAHALLRALPDAVAPQALMGHALLESGNSSVAASHFRRALRLNPLDAGAWAGLAGALAASGKPAAASAALARAALHDPLGSDDLTPGVAAASPLAPGVLYLRRGMPSLAAPELARALETLPRRADLRIHHIEALRRCGDLAEARRQLDMLGAAAQLSLPATLLRAALGPAAEGQRERERSAALDPDGMLARRFFAPELPPWRLPPPPELAWSEDLEPLAPYQELAAGPARSRHERADAGLAPKRAPSAAPPPAPIERPKLPEQRPAEPDPDVKSFVTMTDRLRHRLIDIGGGPRQLAPWSSGGALAQVLLSSRAGLTRRFGEAGFRAVDARLQTLAELLRRRGVHAQVCYFDEPEADGAQFAPTPADPGAVRELVRAFAENYAARGRQLGVLLIVGGDEIVPFHRLPNPIPDDDPLVLSDNPYAADDAGFVAPQRIVARLPEGAGTDAGLLLTILDAMVEHHSRGQQRGRLMLPGRGPRRGAHAEVAAGYCADIWRETSRSVLDALDSDAALLASPPLSAVELGPQSLGARRLLYLNLHGAQGLPNFYGQPDGPWVGPASRLPVALRPDQIDPALAQGSLLLTEACYGAELAGRTAASSIPLRALAAGALACVGATVNAYGSSNTPLVAADLLFQRMMAHLAHGAPVGEALHHARHEFAQEMYRRQGYLDDVDVKTLIEFVLLGDPWAALEGARGEGRAAWPATKIAGIERLPKPRPKAVVLETDLPAELVRRAREALGRMLPGSRGAPLLITAEQNPRRQRKSDPEQHLVFSTHENQATADGYYVTQAAHVTLSGQAVVKMVLTR